MQIISCFTAIVMIFGCFTCARLRCRDFVCIKRFLRCIQYDQYDDFELMLVLHEVMTDRKQDKLNMAVRVTAGLHLVKSDVSTSGNFQQPLHITIEQGTRFVTLDLVDHRSAVLAQLKLDVVKDILSEEAHAPEQLLKMNTKGKGVVNPRVKFSLVLDEGGDLESGGDANMEVDWLVRQQLMKARDEGLASHGKVTEIDLLKTACSGPLELFEGLGNTGTVHVAVHGPPISRKWMLSIYKDEADFDQRKKAWFEVDLLKVPSVQPDPTRNNIFVINYFDEHRLQQRLTLRRIDRPRDVWVEMLQLVITKAHASKKAMKKQMSTSSTASSFSDRDLGRRKQR
jgi:hypothetical protein